MKGVRTFLVVFGACALVAVLAVRYLGNAIRERVAEIKSPLEAVERSQKEALEFAAEREQSDCAPEAVRRAKDCSFNPFCSVGVSVFLLGCLEKARPTPGFCDDVPTHSIGRATWPSKQCSALDASSQSCEQVFSMVENFCEEQRSRGRKRAPS